MPEEKPISANTTVAAKITPPVTATPAVAAPKVIIQVVPTPAQPMATQAVPTTTATVPAAQSAQKPMTSPAAVVPTVVAPKVTAAQPASTQLSSLKPSQPSVAQSEKKDEKTVYSLEGAGVASNAPKVSLLQKLLSKDGKPEAGGAATNNAFTKLFGAQKAGQQSSAGSVAALPPSPSISSLLGPKPVMAKVQQENEKKRKKIAKSLFGFVLFVGFVVYGYFYGQLNAEFTLLTSQFGPNTAQQFERSNSELQKVKTDLNLVNYRMARLWLDEINGQIDAFQKQTATKKSEFSTSIAKKNAEAELQVLGAQIKKSIGEVQKILNQPLGVDTYSSNPVTPEERENLYEKLLKQELTKQRSAIASGAKINREELRIFDNVLRLVENKSFRNMLKARDMGKISEDDFGAMLSRIREEGTDELSAIDKVKKQRLDWGQVIQDVHGVTRKADPLYGQGLFKTVGGFLFSSYGFDSTTGRINIAGITQTSDSKTFSFIAKLVDAIERSPSFKDIDFRSFSKSKNETGDFSSSLSLEFSIQKEADEKDDITQAGTQTNNTNNKE